jgi:excisionase family DNA binding protein
MSKSKLKSPTPVSQTADAAAPPLADASRRLRGRPGRPRKHPAPDRMAKTSEPETGEINRSALRPEPTGTGRAVLQPRLLSLRQAAEYLSLSTWTIRNLVDNGTLPTVQLGTVRRLLFDRLELDRLIEMSR